MLISPERASWTGEGGGRGSSVDGSAGGLDFNGGPRRVWYCIHSGFLHGRFLPWKRRWGSKNGIGGQKIMGPVARAKFVVVVLMMLIE